MKFTEIERAAVKQNDLKNWGRDVWTVALRLSSQGRVQGLESFEFRMRKSSAINSKSINSVSLFAKVCVYNYRGRNLEEEAKRGSLWDEGDWELPIFLFSFHSALCNTKNLDWHLYFFMKNFQLGACTSRYFRIHLILFANYICYRKFGIGKKRNQLFLSVV